MVDVHGDLPCVTLALRGCPLQTYHFDSILPLADPTISQLQKHIRHAAQTSANVVFTDHAKSRMRKRAIVFSHVLHVLRKGRIVDPPEPDIKFPGLKCRMEDFVAGANIAVVVSVEHPKSDLVVITVFDLSKG